MNESYNVNLSSDFSEGAVKNRIYFWCILPCDGELFLFECVYAVGSFNDVSVLAYKTGNL